ncbi:helix-turn-helix transcriptional regulator [Aliiglaciecola lipolytica]|uniref:helix-turn-helix transcriptional regulator n=1 Tax=Aliiglaciecola lipolytica TaxID=477689 RepID=UPI00059056F8|nr:helix-turn-helix domain-containing protein [Aliiglaciecola lipolytica]
MTVQLLSTKQAAEYLSVSASFLEKDRWRGSRIPFIRLANRAIRYRICDLENYINAQVMYSTSSYPEAGGTK